ncbi:unnamed protein product [Sphacelaria rigidula]
MKTVTTPQYTRHRRKRWTPFFVAAASLTCFPGAGICFSFTGSTPRATSVTARDSTPGYHSRTRTLDSIRSKAIGHDPRRWRRRSWRGDETPASVKKMYAHVSKSRNAVYASVARSPRPAGYEGEKRSGMGEGDKELADFNRNVGKVIDTLRRDYAHMFTSNDDLDFDIYTEDLQLVDPSGVVLSGIKSYQRLFATLRFLRQMLISDVSTTFRLSYDASRQQVRVCWHFVLTAFAAERPLHLDGISVYSLNTVGIVRKHAIETLIVNGTPAKPPFAQAWINLPSWIGEGLKGQRARAPGLTSTISGIPPFLVPFCSPFSAPYGTGSLDPTPAFSFGVGGNGIGREPSMELAIRQKLRALSGGRGGRSLLFSPLPQSPFVAIAEQKTPSGALGTTLLPALLSTSSSRDAFQGLYGRRLGVPQYSRSATGVRLAESLQGDGGGSEGSASDNEVGGENGQDSPDPVDERDESNSNPHDEQGQKKGLWSMLDSPWGCETSFDCSPSQVCCDFVVVRFCCSNGLPITGGLSPVYLPIPGRGKGNEA